ncbi:hypothetical protein SAMN04488057_117100 [Cyclobacterium lianum]|uniref:Uncharacterized protein n=1 Tax=Cyclobacterium lianum TaxID=388280 RepID=A0A1M7QFH3_9BACT|nr:hypothetical protein SAMN04488057_117100 [Cyclobacterium lianum]
MEDFIRVIGSVLGKYKFYTRKDHLVQKLFFLKNYSRVLNNNTFWNSKTNSHHLGN